MCKHIVVFEQAEPSPEADVCRMLCAAGNFTIERGTLGSNGSEKRTARPSQAAMAVALTAAEEIVPFLRRVQSSCKTELLIAILPQGLDATYFEALGEIVDDFILWPPHVGEIEGRLRRLLSGHGSELNHVTEQLTQDISFAQFVGQDPAFLRVIEKMPSIARSGASVVITGETGTGKELSARAVHHLSPRRDFPFVAVDCSILPEHLVENELFGHARGAFTDAHADQQGLVVLANKGTLFLDEVDALPLKTQAKLLRFLQERTFRPLGSDKFIQADVSVIAATNRDLEECVAKREFRSDLFYRLNVFRLHLPPLRERISDIPLLARHFLASFAEGGHAKALSASALRKLERHNWPGNVRELHNVIQQAVVFSKASHILPADILLPDAPEGAGEDVKSFREGRARALEHFEKFFIEDALRKNSGNVSRAAQEVKKDRRTFGRLIKKYHINRSAL